MANKSKPTTPASGKNASRMALGVKNIRFMMAGFAVMVAGFLLLAGGGSDNPEVFNYAMFDWRRLVAAPIVIIAGVVVEIIAIMGKFKED